MESMSYKSQVQTQGHKDTCTLETMQKCQEEKDLEIWWLRVSLEYQIGDTSKYEDVLEVNFTQALQKLAKENSTNYSKLSAIVRRYDPTDTNWEGA